MSPLDLSPGLDYYVAGYRVDSQQLRVSTAASSTDSLGKQAHFALTAIDKKTCCKLSDG